MFIGNEKYVDTELQHIFLQYFVQYSQIDGLASSGIKTVAEI